MTIKRIILILGTISRYKIITPQAMHTHTARRAKSEAAREADFDEHRWDVRAFGCDGHDGRTRQKESAVTAPFECRFSAPAPP